MLLNDCRYNKHAVNNLISLNVGWYYTWTLTAQKAYIRAPACVEFVSMVYDWREATAKKLAQVPGNVLLGFNEPDNREHANMTVEEGLRAWPRMMATKKRLGSPAGAKNILKTGSWLDTFMTEATKRKYRVDFMSIHYYGQDAESWSNITAAIEDMRFYLDAVYAKYQKPIWVTEWCLVRWGVGHTPDLYPSFQAQAKFAKAAAEVLDTLPYVERYAYFSLYRYQRNATSYLFNTDGTITPVGRSYRDVIVK